MPLPQPRPPRPTRPAIATAALAAALLGPACGPLPAAAPKPPPDVPLDFTIEPVPAAERVYVHKDKGKDHCAACHDRPAGPALAEHVRLCQKCHQSPHAAHPVNRVVKRPGTIGVPLAPGRVAVCYSCHNPHDVENRKGLRIAGTDFCQHCHAK